MNLKSVALLSVLICGASAQTISVFAPLGVVAPGTSGVVKLMLTTPVTGVQPTAVQFDVIGTVDTGVMTVVVGPTAVAAGKALSCNTSTPARCIIWGMNANSIPNGEIADVTIPILPSAVASTEVISLANLFGSDAGGNSISVAGTPGVINLFSQCDLNHDGLTDIKDVLVVVAQSLGQGTACTNGDLNRDGKCNIFDVYRGVLAALPVTQTIPGSGICKIGP